MEQALRSPKPDVFVVAEAAVGLAETGADLAARPREAERVREFALSPAAAVRVEIVRGKAPAALDGDWRDLLGRAETPNVFMQPRALRAEASGRRMVTLLAWQDWGRGRRLTGFWAFSVGKPHLSIVPITVLRAPATKHAYLSAPLIDRDCLQKTLEAMLDAIAGAPDLPKFIALESMNGSGATYEALRKVLSLRQSKCCRLDTKVRPFLVPGADAGRYLERALSGTSRKKLRQHRRRLATKGVLETTVARSPSDVRYAFEDFLVLELKSWKGRCGTALLCCPNDAAFARGFVSALAEAGDASIYSLELDGRPISVQVALRAGGAVYTWKTAYDEALGDCSPGMLLFEDYSKAFLADRSVAFADSCAFDETSYMAAWTERKPIVDFWFDARRGPSAAFSAVARAQQAYLPLREVVKRAYRKTSAMRARLDAATASRERSPRAADAAPVADRCAPGS